MREGGDGRERDSGNTKLESKAGETHRIEDTSTWERKRARLIESAKPNPPPLRRRQEMGAPRLPRTGSTRCRVARRPLTGGPRPLAAISHAAACLGKRSRYRWRTFWRSVRIAGSNRGRKSRLLPNDIGIVFRPNSTVLLVHNSV